MDNISIGIVNYGNMRPEVGSALADAFQKDSINKNILNGIIQTQSPYIDDNRNRLIDIFLNFDSDWLLFIDTDVEINYNDIITLHDIATKYNLYILGGIYFWGVEHYSTKIQPMIRGLVGNKEEIIFNFPIEKEYFEVSSTGTGCLLIHKSVFQKISNFGPDNNNHWFKTYDDEVGFIGEDIYFCRLARKNGFNVYVTPKIMPNHYKTVKLNYKLFKEQNEEK